jgi:xanthine dehydrogenase YagR molybdenum-binding subunit
MPAEFAAVSSRLYGIENFRGHERLVRTDVQTPGYMRAPFEHGACFAMESCIDELAYALEKDPVTLRLANDTKVDPITKLPLSSRHLSACLERGAERFGWSKRTMASQSMRAGDGTLIGWGVAAGAYPGLIVPTVARLKVTDDGGVLLRIGGHEMGQGIRTALAAAVARKLAVPPEGVVVLVGDTRIAPQHVTAGSWGTASAVPTASDAAEAMLQALDQLAPGRSSNQTPAEILKSVRRPLLEVEVRRKAPGQPDAIYDRLAAGLPCVGGPIFADFVTFSYIAHFVEVRVEPGTRRIRVPRVVSVADCGRVISPRTAASQVRGGVVWGIGATLREASEVDPPLRRISERRSRRIRASRKCGHRFDRRRIYRRARFPVQQRWRKGPGRGITDRRGPCDRQCTVSCNRPPPPRLANPDRTCAVKMRP